MKYLCIQTKNDDHVRSYTDRDAYGADRINSQN